METAASAFQEIPIQNLCFPEQGICAVPGLYYHESAAELLLDGWYNLIYLKKWKRYTFGEKLLLKLAPDCRKHYSAFRVYCDRKQIFETALTGPEEAEGSRELTLELPYQSLRGSVLYIGFVKRTGKAAAAGSVSDGPGTACSRHAVEAKETQASAPHISGRFCFSVPEYRTRNVGIGINICTFRREPYVIRNLGQITRRFFEDASDVGETGTGIFSDIGAHLKVFVVDNGRTLKDIPEIRAIQEKSGGRIRVIENRNVGGAGGFTRGMMEVLRERDRLAPSVSGGLTHALMMDDDAVIDPESIFRVYALLRMLRPRFRDASVGGAMLREDIPQLLFCQGEWWENGDILHTGLRWDLREYEKASHPFLTEPGKENRLYSGWWFCCCSLNVVRDDNLPLPVFLHCDDIEYGLRNSRYGTIFLNGVGVWHRDGTAGFVGSNLYYDIRNTLIAYSLHGPSGLPGFLSAVKFPLKIMLGALLKLNYRNVSLAYNGILDFLKGPEWLLRRNPEELNETVRRQALSLKPVKELLSPTTPVRTDNRTEERLSPCDSTEIQRQISEVHKALSEKGEEALRKERYRCLSLKHIVTLNGLLLPAGKDPVLFLPQDPPWRLFRIGTAVMYEPLSGKAALIKKDRKLLLRSGKLLLRSATALLTSYVKAAEDWRKGEEKLIGKDTWVNYLE